MDLFINKRFLTIIICLLSVVHSYSQIKISEFIQGSKIASADQNKLFFVDFWATWCGPCIAAKEHLGVLQSQFKSDLYVVSLTRENPLLVERFLKKKPTDLAVAIDYNGETFKEHNVRILPDGVLYNAEGEVLWRGGAPDLKASMVAEFLKQHSSLKPLESFVSITSMEEEKSNDYVPLNAIEITNIQTVADDLQLVDNDRYLQLRGSLSQIIGYLGRVNKNQLAIDEDLNTNFEVFFKKPFNDNENLAFVIINEMNLNVVRKHTEGEVLNLDIKTPRFWDTNQIDWGNNNSRYLVGDSQIQADNVSLKDIAYQLSSILDLPVIIPDNTDLILSLHDWDFHYKFFELMKSDLQDNYGIISEKKIASYPVYYIQKKAP